MYLRRRCKNIHENPMKDIKDEIREAEDWKVDAGPGVYMNVHELVTLAIRGFATCKEDSLKTGDFCASRKYCGEDACNCIRASFPAPEYYELYLRLREYYLHNVGEALLEKIAGEHIREKQ